MGNRCQFCDKKGTETNPLQYYKGVVTLEGIPVEIIFAYHPTCVQREQEQGILDHPILEWI